MKCWLEMNTRLFGVLRELSDGYETGNFDDFFPYLAEDCVMESHWVLSPNIGAEAVRKYLMGKGETLKKTGSFPEGSICEFVGGMTTIPDAVVTSDGKTGERASVSLAQTPGKFCLLLVQDTENEKVSVLVDITLNGAGLVRRIDLCNPEMFTFRSVDSCVFLYPGEAATENDDGMVHVSEEYYDELYTFFSMTGTKFDEYENLVIPMVDWLAALEYWEKFNAAESFDDAFEELAGVSYDGDWHAKDSSAAAHLINAGCRLWKKRDMGRLLVKRLREWTETCCSSYDCIFSEGW